jgi:hypothetical protein
LVTGDLKTKKASLKRAGAFFMRKTSEQLLEHLLSNIFGNK